MSTEIVEVPEVNAERQDATALVAEAKSFDVVDHPTYELMQDVQNRAHDFIKGVQAKFKDPKAKAAAAHKSIVALEKEIITPAETAKSLAGQKCVIYVQAKRKAEEERLRKEREEAEALARLQREEAEKAAQAALEADDVEAYEQAEQMKEEAVPEVFMPPTAPTVRAKGYVENWQAEVTDLDLLVQAVAAGKAPLDCLMANTAYLSKRAKADRANLAIPGVRVFDKGTVRAG